MRRLRGHRDQITALAFVSAPPLDAADQASSSMSVRAADPSEDHLISSSKDTLLKLWELPTQHCVSTVVAHRNQVWSFATFLDPSTSKVVIITGGGEGESRAWEISAAVLSRRHVLQALPETSSPIRAFTPLFEGLLPLATLSHVHRIAQIAIDPTGQLLAFQTTERSIEILRLRTDQEVRKKIARRQKREREKQKEKEKQSVVLIDESDLTDPKAPSWKDRLASWIVIRTPGKIRSFAFGVGANKLKPETTIMAALSNNSVEVYQLPSSNGKVKKGEAEEPEAKEATRLHALELPGHRTDIRTLCISSDDALLASGANGSLKIWNIKTTKCLRTMECGYSICSTFLPGDRHVLVGTKTGELLLHDVGSSTLLETFNAHQGAVWGICVRPDGKGLVSGSADKDIKFWDFEIKDINVNSEESDTQPVRTPPNYVTGKMGMLIRAHRLPAEPCRWFILRP